MNCGRIWGKFLAAGSKVKEEWGQQQVVTWQAELSSLRASFKGRWSPRARGNVEIEGADWNWESFKLAFLPLRIKLKLDEEAKSTAEDLEEVTFLPPLREEVI